ncbi:MULTISPECIES: hypothetical protein [Pseudoalteromonas]|uniref:Lipoprotein n=1 Tax=Pseudoalteromonas haloplanktis TaxID=228 RepID=A0ABU1BDU4_PSEHA|nr:MULTISPECIES: hypothetical protein [Pseudoalteromonas]MCF6145863.1 hypothetical protein [Pseudoalteromonas mariniglutinosa NCIMB 1770]MDQ9092561.1 hypothetical protein [Pseudoalteromonas haloplanktis]TMN71199.1 hypothetical protein CWB85_12090 [Pseudoalteromonas sp. S1727]BDF95694.1 hypothetical protein KAN5_25320 [Pseudoalteromonas sp. KAN5]
MKKILLATIIVTVGLTGCKTIESVQKDLGSITSGLTGEQATPEQLQLAYEKAEQAFQEALTAYNLIDSESLADFDAEKVAEAKKIWQVLDREFDELRLSPEHALDSASLFSSDTVADEVMEQSLEVINLVTAASLSKERITAVLKPVRDEFAVLTQIDAKIHFEKRYALLDEQHQELKELLIDGKEAQVEKYVPQLLEQLTALEKDAVVQFYFSEHINKIYSLANSDKVSVFPVVYGDVKSQLAEGQAYAQKNYRDYDNIKVAADLVAHQIDRINSLFSEYTELKTALGNKEIESELLKFEAELAELTEAVGLGDLRNLTFSEQLKEVKNKL